MKGDEGEPERKRKEERGEGFLEKGLKDVGEKEQ